MRKEDECVDEIRVRLTAVLIKRVVRDKGSMCCFVEVEKEE